MSRNSTKLRFAGVLAAILAVGTAHALEQGVDPGDGNTSAAESSAAIATFPGMQAPLAGYETGGPRVSNLFDKVPLFFEPLQIDGDAGPMFLGRSKGYSVVLSGAEIALSLRRPDPGLNAVLRLRLLGSAANPEITGLDRLASESNYFLGADPAKWRSHVPHFARTRIEGVYPGIDLVFYGNGKQLEYDFIVAPGADYRTIALAIDGAQSLAVEDGDLVARIGDGEVVRQALVVYQEIDGERVPVDGRFVLRGGFEVGFEVAAYDPTEPLVIDPVLGYSTYFGGPSSDLGIAIAIDADGNAYMAGSTTGGVEITDDLRPAGVGLGSDATYVVKFDPSGAFVHSTFIGGDANDNPLGIAVDAAGAAYVTGQTQSSNFPTTAGAFSTSCASCPSVIDGYLTKISPDGASLVYSTYLGGSGSDGPFDVAVDSTGNAIVVGTTNSMDFPTTPSPLQSALSGPWDAFVTKFNGDGSALMFSTYLGGDSAEDGYNVGLDGSDTIYVRGRTASTDFPVTAGAFQTALGGGSGFDFFVTKIASSGSSILASTYIGVLSDGGRGGGLAVDAAGYAYVTGNAQGSLYPLMNPIDTQADGGLDAVLTKLNPDLTALLYSTYFGGSRVDSGNEVAVDAAGNAYVSGWTVSMDFPVTPDAIQDTLTSLSPGACAPSGAVTDPSEPCPSQFVTKFNAAGAIVFSTYIGGSNTDSGVGISNFRHSLAVDALGNMFLTGTTHSADFPTANADDATFNGVRDAFVLRIGAIVRDVVAIFHIDSVDGDDITGDGSIGAPWQTLSMVNAIALIPGDRVLLKRDSIFRERLIISADEDGTSDDPIIVDAYGDGALPIISAGHQIGQGSPWTAVGNGEYRLVLGALIDFYTSIPVMVRANNAGIDTYTLLPRGIAGSLAADSYATSIEAVAELGGSAGRVLYYRPLAGADPVDFEFEISKRNFAVLIDGDHASIGNFEAILGNQGNAVLDPPTVSGTVEAHGSNVEFHHCTVAFSRSDGLVVFGENSVIDTCTAEYNSSTGLYIRGKDGTGSIIQNSIARFNGNLEFADQDRGGIGIQSSDTIIRNNVVHDNGNINDTTAPRIAGDAAIGSAGGNPNDPNSGAHNVLIQNNFIYNSARAAIAMSYEPGSYGHGIIGNVIYNWNLVGPLCDEPASGCLNASRSAIHTAAFGDTPNSGLLTIWNNTIYSDQENVWLYGILLSLPTNADRLRDTSVLNNIVYMPNNTHSDSVGLRTTRSHHFYNAEIDHNDIYVPITGNNYEFFGVIGPPTAADVSQMIILCGMDTECSVEPQYELNGLNIDPELNLAAVNPVDPVRFDLVPGSPVQDAGKDVGLMLDFLGRPIPFGDAPDMGAFESPVNCLDTDQDGVCDDVDVCMSGPVEVQGFLPPMAELAPEGLEPLLPDKAFKQKRTLPLKVVLSCNGVALGDTDIAPPLISEVVRDGDAFDLPVIDLDAGDSNDGGLAFRYSDVDELWIYNLSTRGLETGNYTLSILTPENLSYTATFVLR